MKKFLLLAVLLLAVLSAAWAAQTQDLKFFAVNLRPDGVTPTTIHFYCSQDYDKAECLKDAIGLRKALAPYPLQLLAEWSYYLATAQEWKPLARSRGGNACSVAFTMLLGRATVLDRSLISPSADRTVELQRCGAITGSTLLNLAITHEMGHAICQEKREREADNCAKELRAGQAPSCLNQAAQKPSSGSRGVEVPPDWKALARSHGDPAVSPAFSLLLGRATVIDHSLFYGPADDNVELHLKPEIIDAMRSAWTKAGGGVSRSEAGFYVGRNGSTTAADRTNQDGALQFTIPAGTTAIFHTHPQGGDRMSQQDIDVANQNHIDMYVISRSGLYHYRPGMKWPEMLQTGTNYLTNKKGSK